MERDHVVSGNDTCYFDVQNMALDFLRSCDEVNEARFGLLSLISLGYVLGEMLLVIGIDVVGRRPYLSKHLDARQGSQSIKMHFIIQFQNSAFFIQKLNFLKFTIPKLSV